MVARCSVKNYLSNNNSKLAKSGIFAWGIPAGQSASGKITCPGAGTCKTGCYALQGFFVMPVVKAAQEARLTLSQSAEFIDVIDAEIKRRKVKKLRIHDSGDFYTLTYLRYWIEIMRLNPEVQFYAYTKMVPMFKSYVCPTLPANFTVIFSFGGKWDNFIDASVDRHSAVFESLEALTEAGYADAHADDTQALTDNHRVGLVYHGAKSKAWQARGAA